MADTKAHEEVIAIRLFGTPEVRRGDQLIHVPRRKSRALLYYLAAHTEAISRGQLLGLFWPDLDSSSARHSLRSALYALRQTIGTALQSESDRLSLDSQIQVDVRTFAETLSLTDFGISHLSSAMSLYRGDFLTGVTSEDLPAFEDWIAIEREHLRRLGVRALVVLSRLHEVQGDLVAALEALEHALSFDPLQEDIQRAGLRLHHLSGDRTGAIRRYDQFRRLLDAEMGVPPMPETRALYDAIVMEDTREVDTHILTSAALKPTLARTALQVEPASSNISLPFVGRRNELDRLLAFHDSHGLLLIEGPPGIGKTRLVEAFIESARLADTAVLSLLGRGRELEQNLPYQPVIDMLRKLMADPTWPALRAGLTLPAIWQAEMTRLLPELAASDSPPMLLLQSADESRLWEGVHQFLRTIAQQRPLIFTIDDLHWADASTMGLLGYLVRQTGRDTTPILFMATSRSGTMHQPLQMLIHALLREERLERIPLRRLSESAVVTLARTIVNGDAQQLGAWLNQGSEGDPFILAALVRHARDNKILGEDGALNPDAVPTAPVVPQSVYTLIQARLERLSASARRMLDAAVIVGREFDYEVAARAAALSDQAAIEALEECRAAGLIKPIDDYRFAFDHNLTLAVIHEETTAARRRLLHRHVAGALEKIEHDNLDVVAGTIALHYEQADMREKAARFALLAGRRAAGLAAWQEAIAFYEQTLAGIKASERQTVLLALGQAYLPEGRITQATEILREALDLAQKQDDIEIENMAMQFLAESLLMQDYYEDVIDLAQEIIGLQRPEMSTIGYALMGAALSQEGANLVEAASHLRRAESDLQQHVDERSLVLLAEVKFELGTVFAKQGDLASAVREYRAVLDLLHESEAEMAWRWHILAYNNLAFHLHLLDDPQAEEYVQIGLALAREQGAIALMPFLLSTAGEIALARRALPAAESYFQDGLVLAEQFDRPERIVGLTANLGLVARDRGQTDLAVERLKAALQKAEALHNYYQATQIRLWLAPLVPDSDALALLDEARAMSEKRGYGRLLDEAARLTP